MVAASDLTTRPRKTKDETSARRPARAGVDCCRPNKAAKSNKKYIMTPMLLEILKVSRTKPLDSSDNGCDDNKRGNVAAGRLWVCARVPSNEDSITMAAAPKSFPA